MKRKKSHSATLFLWYSYANNIANGLLQLLPPLFRSLIFKLLLGTMGRNVFIDYGCYFRFFSKIHVYHDVSINRGCGFFPSYLFDQGRIVLRDGAVIGPYCLFLAAGQDCHSPDLADVAGEIIVGANAYIGGRSIIRYGVTIGDGAVVGAGSVVVEDVDPFTVVAGSPARVIGSRPRFCIKGASGHGSDSL